MSTSDVARTYANEHADQFKQQLFEMLRIPSLSGDPAHAGDVRAMAEWLAAHMESLGLAKVAVMETAGHPVVYGEWLGAGPDKPTVLVYGHYDVVPASMEDGWDTNPFEPVERDGMVYARGVTDDKGQLFIHVKALEAYLKTEGAAPVNVKFLIEGEEEVSSPNLLPFIQDHLDLLAADVCVISDSSMARIDEPAVTHSLRGMTYMEIEVTGPREDLHSGFFGGAVHNPANALAAILASLYDADNVIAKERVSARPTMDVNGLWSGYSGPGPKTIIPSSAGAKVSSRLVANQDPDKIYELVKAHVARVTPATVNVEVRLLTTGRPALIPFDLPEMQAAASAYEKGWGHAPVFTRGGGSIPVVADITDLMQIPVVMMGYGLDTDGLHSPNEHYRMEMFQRGIETAIVYLEELSLLD